MIKFKVLFVGSRNGSRSLMAEAFLNHLAGDRFEAESAGFDDGGIDPLAVEAMREVGIDISDERTKSVFSLYQDGRMFQTIVSVCDKKNNERHPIYPGHREYVDWDMCDPEAVTDPEDRLTAMRIVRNNIRDKVEAFIAEERDFTLALPDVRVK